MRPATLLATVLLLAQGIAGCADPSTGAGEAGSTFHQQWSERALETGDLHNHTDAAAHANRTTPNFRVLGHDLLDSELYGGPPGATFCGDAQQMPDGRRIAAAESRSKVGFTLVDVTDPADPEWLGELVMETTRVYDLAVVPDGRHVVLVTQNLQNLPVRVPPVSTVPAMPQGADGPPGPGGPALPVAPADAVRPALAASDALVWRSPCVAGGAMRLELPAHAHGDGGEVGRSEANVDPVPRPMSILLVDISDPSRPAIVDHHPLYGNGHSAFSTVLDGRTWVLATTTGPGTQATAYESTSAFEFYEVVDTAAGSRLRLLSIYKPQPDLRNAQPPLAVGPRGHDAWIAVHPVTGQTLAYLAAWERMEILDLADPTRPRLVGSWTDMGPGREGFTGEIHSVLPLGETWDGRHYTIVGPEWRDHPQDHPTGIFWVLDTTDLGSIRAVAGWTLPHEVEWSGEFMFSNHYYAVSNRTLLASMYHAGVWAIDLGPLASPPDGFVHLRSVGVFLPVDPEARVATPLRWTPTTEEVLAFEDGTLLTFDGYTGAWTFAFDASDPAPAPEPWPLTPP